MVVLLEGLRAAAGLWCVWSGDAAPGKAKQPENQLSDSVGTSLAELRRLSGTRACKSEGRQTASDNQNHQHLTHFLNLNTQRPEHETTEANVAFTPVINHNFTEN